MHTKLTLRIDEKLIRAAKKYSATHHKSLSQLITDYFHLITEAKTGIPPVKHSPPITRALKGMLRGKKIDEVDYKKYLADKHQ